MARLRSQSFNDEREFADTYNEELDDAEFTLPTRKMKAATPRANDTSRRTKATRAATSRKAAHNVLRQQDEQSDSLTSLGSAAISFIIKYLIGVVAGALKLASPLFSVAFFLIVLYYAGYSLLHSWVFHGPAYAAVRTIAYMGTSACSLPGASFIPACQNLKDQTVEHEHEHEGSTINFTQLMEAQYALEGIVVDGQGFTSVRYELPITARALEDLSYSIIYTDLTSAESLNNELGILSKRARSATEQILRLDESMDYSVDMIRMFNEMTASTLAKLNEREASRSPLSRTIARSLPHFAFYLVPIAPPTVWRVREVFLDHVSDVIDRVNLALEDAEVVQQAFDRMNMGFGVVAGLIAKDDKEIKKERDHLLNGLFDRFLSVVPGNQKSQKRKEFESQLKSLGEVARVERAASAHVDGIVSQLRKVRAKLEGLRDRAVKAGKKVKAKEKNQDVPFEAYLKSIMIGTERMAEAVNMKRVRRNDEELRRRADKGERNSDAMVGKEYMIDAPTEKKRRAKNWSGVEKD